jgi:phage shock protein PspC (stress-responsive transcriptional regulator)
MQQVIQVSLSGHPAMFRLEMEAFDALRHYLDRAGERLSEDPDQAEVLNDLEQSIGEKLAARLPSEESVITLARVEAVLAEVGSVETDVAKPAATTGLARGRRLYRIQEGQEYFGVCQGMAAYSNIDVDMVRTIFILLALLSGGALILVYIALGFLLPVVPTYEDWLAAQATLSNAS